MSDIWRCVWCVLVSWGIAYLIFVMVVYCYEIGKTYVHNKIRSTGTIIYLLGLSIILLIGILWSAGRFIHMEWEHINQFPIIIEFPDKSISLPTGIYRIGGK